MPLPMRPSDYDDRWLPISSFRDDEFIPRRVDVWLSVSASPMSFGMADAFRVCDAYRRDGKWFHPDNGMQKELRGEYITHFMNRPSGPGGETDW